MVEFNRKTFADAMQKRGFEVPEGAADSKLKRYAKAAGAELISGFGVIPMAAGVVQGAASIAREQYTPEKLYENLSRFGNVVAETVTGDFDSAVDLITQDFENAKQSVYRAAMTESGRRKEEILNDPTVDPEAKALVAQSFDPTKDINWGLRNAAWFWELGSDVAGIDRSPGNFPLDEELVGILALAPIGVPRSLITRAAQRVGNAMGRNAALRYARKAVSSMPMKALGRAAEVTTPLTIPWTPQNMAFNVGAQVAMMDATRTAFGEDSFLNRISETLSGAPITQMSGVDPAMMTPQQVQVRKDDALRLLQSTHDMPELDGAPTPWVKYTLGGGAALGAGFLLWRAAKGRRLTLPRGPSILETGGDSVTRRADPGMANRNVAEFSISETGQRPPQILSGLNKAEAYYDATGPTRAAIRKAVEGNEQALAVYEAAETAGTRLGRTQAVRQAINDGIMPDGTRTRAIVSLQRRIIGMQRDPVAGMENLNIRNKGDLTKQYIIALDAKNERKLARDSLDVELERLNREIAQAPDQDTIQRLNQQASEIAALREGDIRMSVQQYSDNDLDRIIAQARRHPDIDQTRAHYQRVASDWLDYRVRNQLATRAEADEWRRTRPDYMPWQEDVRGLHESSGPAVSRVWSRVRNAVLPEENIATRQGAALQATRSVDIDTIRDRTITPERGVQHLRNVVNNPVDPFVSIERYANRTITEAEHGAVRRLFVDTLANSPHTKGSLRKVDTVSRKQAIRGKMSDGKEIKDHLVPVPRAGEVELWEFSDSLIARTLEFAPAFAEGTFWQVNNMLRRGVQAGTTGFLRPEWAATSILWDGLIGSATRPHGRSLGAIDAAVRLASRDKFGFPVPTDPTIYLEALGAGSYTFSRLMQKQIGEWIANDLAQGSTMFGRMVQNKFGRAYLENVGTAMIDSYYRSLAGLAHGKFRGGTSAAWLDNQADHYVQGWVKTNNPIYRMYGLALESAHNATKMAYFMQNVAVRKMLGRPMTDGELSILAKEMRSLSGDMSRSGLSKGYQEITQTIPYSNVAVQSFWHVVRAAKNRPDVFIPAVMSGVVVPQMMSMSLIEKAGEATRNWWYNEQAGFTQSSSIALPLNRPIEATMEILRGEYKHNPDDWVFVRMAPELIPFKTATTIGLMALGYGEGRTIGSEWDSNLWEGVEGILPFFTPPIIGAPFAAAGYNIDVAGAFNDDLFMRPHSELRSGPNPNAVDITSDIERNMAEAVVALTGTVGRFAVDSMRVIEDVDEREDEGVWDALGRIYDKGAFKTKRGTAIANQALWGIETQYSLTPLAEEYYKTFNALGRVFGQFEVEMFGFANNREGRILAVPQGELPNRIKYSVDGVRPEVIRSMVAVSETYFNENPIADNMKQQMSDLLRIKEQIRANTRLPAQKQHEILNRIEIQRQNIMRTVHDNTVKPWLAHMKRQFGEDFKGPEDLVGMVERSTGPAR